MELINGRPTNESGRLQKEIRSYDFLDDLGIDYSRVDHEPAMTMEICEEIDKVLMAATCKNLFLIIFWEDYLWRVIWLLITI